MTDSRLFARGKMEELRQDLLESTKDGKPKKVKNVLKRIVANMTTGQDMWPLFTDVTACLRFSELEIKKLVYLYIVNYATCDADLALMALNSFLKDAKSSNPLVRALSLRTLTYIDIPQVVNCINQILPQAISDTDPYVRKTAALCIGKMFNFDPKYSEAESYMNQLEILINDGNYAVVANALVSAREIQRVHPSIRIPISTNTANNLAAIAGDCSEWAQIYILEGICHVNPRPLANASNLIDRIIPLVQHSNSSVIFSSIKVIINLLPDVHEQAYQAHIFSKIVPPLVSLMGKEPEIQYVSLENINLLLQKYPQILVNEVEVFYCKYYDPPFVKSAKLRALLLLITENNADRILSELKEYAGEANVDFVKRSVHAIGMCAIKLESHARKCVEILVELIQKNSSYVIQECVVVLRDIFRQYPNKYEGAIVVLCNFLGSLESTDAKAAMIWIIGHYSNRITNSVELLGKFYESFAEEPFRVQSSLLVAVVKLFLYRPNDGKDLCVDLLTYVTKNCDNPDLRDRGYIYLRMLKHNLKGAMKIIPENFPKISLESVHIDSQILEKLISNIDSAATISLSDQKLVNSLLSS